MAKLLHHNVRVKLPWISGLLVLLAAIVLVTAVACSGAGVADPTKSGTLPNGDKAYSCNVKFDKGNAPRLMVDDYPPSTVSADPGDTITLPGRGCLPPDVPANTMRSGNYFIGWATKNAEPGDDESFVQANGRVVGTAGEKFKVEGDTTLYAVYVATMNALGSLEQVGSLKLDPNLGTDTAHPVLAGWPDGKDGTSLGSKYIENFASGHRVAPEGAAPMLRHAYKFAGWSENKNATPGEAHPPGQCFPVTKWDTESNGFTVYAIWEAYQAKDLTKVKYIWNFWCWKCNITTPEFGKGQPVIVPDSVAINKMPQTGWPTPPKKGIIGWAYKANATIPDFRVGETIYPTEYMEVYAVWAGEARFINYSLNEINSVEQYHQLFSYMVEPITNSNTFYSIGQDITLAATPKIVRGDWKGDFLGWATTEKKPAQGWPAGEPFAGGSTIKMPDGQGALNFYAQWKEKDFGIVYYVENNPPDTCYSGSAPLWKYGYIGEKVRLDEPGDLRVKNRDDLKFAGWGKSPTATAAEALAPGTEFEIKVAWDGEETSQNFLYAIWVQSDQ